MNQTICNAIKNLTCLQVVYGGYTRLVEPHTYGISSKDNESVRVWQVSGGSESGEYTGWKIMTVDKIERMVATDIPSEAPRPDYKMGDPFMAHIICEIQL